MLACKHCKLRKFKATEAATTIPMTRGMLWWASQFGLPEWLITDGGPHYASHAMEMLTAKLKVQHHITLAHCLWANGSIEVVGREQVRTTQLLLSEYQLGMEEWEDPLPVVNYGLNHMPRTVLGGRTPIEVITGHRPDTPVVLVLWMGKYLKDATSMVTRLERVQQHCEPSPRC